MAEMRMSRIPVATYRLQFRNGMTFDRAAGLIPYWKALGISHLYASPIFSAVSGSTHGYDVADPNTLDEALGGLDGFRRLSDGLRAAGLGLILDIVPNHMAASLENPYWRDVLKRGRESRFAGFFDNDWDQRLTLPVLGEPIEDIVTSGHGKLRRIEATGETVFDYYGQHYPLDPVTYSQAVIGNATDGVLPSDAAGILALLERQCWQMIHWREAARGLSYRRFFEITGLVGVRVEDAEVFKATHRLILDLVAEGRVQGLRIDHIDGLADPAGYIGRLRQATGPETYIVVEKIVEGDERLPEDWPVDGTTGYEFIADLAGLLTDDTAHLDRGWEAVAPDFGDPEGALMDAKRLLVDVNFEGEVAALIRRAQALADTEGREIPGDMLAQAVRALVAGFDVYRTYGTSDGLAEQDRLVLRAMFDRLTASAPSLQPALAFLADLLFERVGPAARDGALTFRTRLQHLTGPVLAKSLEDTFFYRYNRLIALNEVGGDPIGRAGSIEHFHRRMTIRRATQPHALSTTATHDAKRGEDARARLHAISEAPDDWIALTHRWRRRMILAVQPLADGPAPEPAVEWLLFQALAGMLRPDFDPRDAAMRQDIRDRFLLYVEKALREAKLRTNWSAVNETYETAVRSYADAALGSDAFMRAFWSDIQPFVATGLVNSLSQTLLKLTAPGVPDIYQGTEGSDTSLVDPDNRRPPDYEALAAMGRDPSPDDFEAAKAWLLRSGLAARNRHPDLFASGGYLPLETSGERRENVLAFARMHEGQWAIIALPRLVHEAVLSGTLLSGDYWRDTAIHVPETMGAAEDAFRPGEPMQIGGRLRVADLFRDRPYALLTGENSNGSSRAP